MPRISFISRTHGLIPVVSIQQYYYLENQDEYQDQDSCYYS